MELVQLVTFEVGNGVFGIDVSKVQEVIKYEKVTPTPESIDIVEGIIEVRGNIIPVIDLHKRFHLDLPSTYSKCKILITEVKGYVFGFIVGKVDEVSSIALSDFSPPPPGSSHPGSEFTIGIAHRYDQLLLYLDIDLVLNIDELLREYHYAGNE